MASCKLGISLSGILLPSGSLQGASSPAAMCRVTNYHHRCSDRGTRTLLKALREGLSPKDEDSLGGGGGSQMGPPTLHLTPAEGFLLRPPRPPPHLPTWEI